VSIAPVPAFSISVYRAEAFRVTVGANLNDPMSFLEELVLDDIYQLAPETIRDRLTLQAQDDGSFAIAGNTALGEPGATVHLDCVVTLMSPDGSNTEAVILVEVDDLSTVSGVYLVPVRPLQPKTDYHLVRADRKDARRKFAQLACVSFTRGTHITLATGAQVPIEELAVDDQVLTRDSGAQPVRWIGRSTVRATGELAPIVITAGTLNNTKDLIVSPDHHLFIYQRTDRVGAGRSELMVRARHLVNGDTVYAQEGGHVEYFQLLFDRHHIIYAEGIAAESMLIDPRTKPALPAELLEKLTEIMPGHTGTEPHGLDVQRALLDRPDAIDLLRLASAR